MELAIHLPDRATYRETIILPLRWPIMEGTVSRRFDLKRLQEYMQCKIPKQAKLILLAVTAKGGGRGLVTENKLTSPSWGSGGW